MKEKKVNNEIKKWYELPQSITNELETHTHNIRNILKDDPGSRDFMLKQLLSAYTEHWIDEKLNHWVHEKYDASLNINDYNNLLSATATIPRLVKGTDFLVTEEVHNSNHDEFTTYSAHTAAIQQSIMHQYIELSQLSTEEVYALGEAYQSLI